MSEEIMGESEALDLRQRAEAFGLDAETSGRALAAVVLLHREVARLREALTVAEYRADVSREVAEMLVDAGRVTLADLTGAAP